MCSKYISKEVFICKSVLKLVSLIMLENSARKSIDENTSLEQRCAVNTLL